MNFTRKKTAEEGSRSHLDLINLVKSAVVRGAQLLLMSSFAVSNLLPLAGPVACRRHLCAALGEHCALQNQEQYDPH